MAQGSQAMTWVNRQIKLLRTLKCDIRTRYNQHLPVSKMPPEIFSQIFQYCVEFQELAFFRVCRAWRQIGLDNPRIWTCIDLHKPALAKWMLRRVQDCALDVYIPNLGVYIPNLGVYIPNLGVLVDTCVGWSERDSILYQQALGLALAKSRNIWDLDIRASESDLRQILIDLKDASSLRYLSIDADSEGISTETQSFTPLHAPYLREVDIRCPFFPLQVQGQVFRHLTVFIYNIDEDFNTDSVHRLPLLSVLDLLLSMSQLIELRLYDVLGNNPGCTDNIPSILITGLKSLTLWNDEYLFLDLLECLDLPNLSSLTLTHGLSFGMDINVPLEGNTGRLLRELERIISQSTLFPLSTAYKLILSSDSLGVEGMHSSSIINIDVSGYHIPQAVQPASETAETIPDSTRTPEQVIISELLRLIPSNRILSMQASYTDWDYEILAALPCLTQLQVPYPDPQLVTKLQKCITAGKTFEQLSTLILVTPYTPNLGSEELVVDSVSSSLAELLICHIEMGMPLKKVIFDRSSYLSSPNRLSKIEEEVDAIGVALEAYGVVVD